jgi:hypothetical protein
MDAAQPSQKAVQTTHFDIQHCAAMPIRPKETENFPKFFLRRVAKIHFWPSIVVDESGTRT